jgi:hypothetical protein
MPKCPAGTSKKGKDPAGSKHPPKEGDKSDGMMATDSRLDKSLEDWADNLLGVGNMMQDPTPPAHMEGGGGARKKSAKSRPSTTRSQLPQKTEQPPFSRDLSTTSSRRQQLVLVCICCYNRTKSSDSCH